MPLRTRLSTTWATAAWPSSGSLRDFEIDRLGKAAHLARAVLRIDERGIVRLAVRVGELRDRRHARAIGLDGDHDAVAGGRRRRVEREFERQRRRRAVAESERRGRRLARRRRGAADSSYGRDRIRRRADPRARAART